MTFPLGTAYNSLDYPVPHYDISLDLMATDAKSTQTRLGTQAPRSRPETSLWAQAQSSVLLPAFLLFFAALALYGSTQTRANTFDAVSYANQFGRLYPRTHDLHWLFHPHHLLFNALGYALWRAAKVFGYAGGALPVLQSLNSVLGAAGIAVYYVTLRRLLQRSRWLPLLVAVGLAVSFGYWICATDGRVNMPSLFLMLCAFSVLCRVMQSPQIRLAALVGAISGAAVLFHESAGLFVGVAGAGVWLAEDDPLLLPAAMRVRRRYILLAFGSAWTAAVLLPYLLLGVFALHLHSLSAFRHWMSTYSELGWWWDFHVLHNLRLDLYAFRHAAFVEPPGKQGTFHLNRHVPFALSRLYFATLLGWMAAVYAFFAALPLLGRSHNRRMMGVCLVWIVVYTAFFTVWSPGYFVFWVPVLVPTGVMLALALAHYRARRGGIAANWLVGLWIVLYAVLNAQASILPHLAEGSDPFRRMAADFRLHSNPGDLALVAGAGDGGPLEVTLPYFADRDVVSLHTLLTRRRNDKALAFADARTQIDTALAVGHAVYALDEAIPGHNPRTQNALAVRHHVTAADLQGFLVPYRRTLAWLSPRGPVWRLSLVLARDKIGSG